MKIQEELKLRQELIDAMTERTDYMHIFNDMADELFMKNFIGFSLYGRFFWKYWYRYRDIAKRYR